MGLTEYHNLPDMPQAYCAPQGVTVGQLRDAVIKYLMDHPERRHLPFARLALDALKASFPCRKNSN
jgi:hypothetical protein